MASRKKEHTCEKFYGKRPRIKEAIAGQAGIRIWAIWTHRYYGDLELSASGNILYVLRLVVENKVAAIRDSLECQEIAFDAAQHETQVKDLRAVLQTAQVEVTGWNLSVIKLWDPTNLVQDLIKQTDLQYCKKLERMKALLASSRYGEGSGKDDMLGWVANRHSHGA